MACQHTMPKIQSSSQLSLEAPGAIQANKLGPPRGAVTLVPSSPPSLFHSPLSEHRAMAAGRSPFVSQGANLQQTVQGISSLQSSLGLLGCQRQCVQPIGTGETPEIKHLQAVIQNELHAFQKTLVAERDAAVKQFKAVMEARFQAESERHQDLAKRHCDLEENVHRLEGNLSKVDSRLSRTVSQQMAAQAEHQVFENQAIDIFQSFEESLRTLANILPDGAWPAVLEAQQTCRNLDGHGSKGKGGRLATLPASSSHASSTGGASSSHASLPASSSSEQGAFLVSDPCLASFPTQSEARTSIRISVLEVALASMQRHEQEQIRCLQKRIQDSDEHKTLPWWAQR